MQSFSKLTGAQQAAVLLLCLGEETTSKVFAELTDKEVRLISRCMMSIEHVPAEMAVEAIQAFKQSQQEYSGLFINGGDFARKAISQATGEERRKNILNQLEAEGGGQALEAIATMEPRLVANLLEQEHPQTMALVLSTQTPEHTGRILSFMSEELKSEVMYRIAKLDRISPEVIKQIELALQREIGVAVHKEQQQVGGIDKVVEILGRMEKGVDRNILIRMEEYDPETTEIIRKKMFTFHDLVDVDNMAMQTILKEINTDMLTLALKTAGDDLKNKIFNNISARAAEMIKEDLEVLGPKKLSEVELVQQQVVDIALRLEDEGKIILPGRGGRDVLV